MLVHTIRSAINPDLAHIIEIQGQLQSLLGGNRPPISEVAIFLDGLDHPCRVAAIRSLGASHQKRLYDAAEGFRTTTIDDVVPMEQGVRTPVRHFGKNSLPAFSIFEKRFLRPNEDAQELWGYNFQTMTPITGPGYFIARNAPDRGEVDIDYYSVPPESPLGWPAVKDNEHGLSKLVYGYMVDRLRGITRQVSIGRAWKKGKIQPAWFILCRE
jgi:hypothetical protein